MPPAIDGYARYAVYLAPAPGSALAAFGNGWLGRDPQTGDTIDRPAVAGLDASTIDRVTRSPARYGFHGTLKAPFALCDGETAHGLACEIEALAASRGPVVIDRLALDALGPFLALVPDVDTGPVDDLARACLTGLDRFRRPLDDAERLRRKPESLSAGQARLLDKWGYPYVLGEFRFHMTLTGPLDTGERDMVRTALEAHGATAFAASFADLCLFGDPGNGEPFRLIRRFRLSQRGARGEQ